MHKTKLKLILFFVLSSAEFFGFVKIAHAACENLIITAVENLPLGNDTQFVKIQNASPNDWVFKTGSTYLSEIRLVTDSKKHYISILPGTTKILAGESFILTNSKDFPTLRKLHKLDDEIKLFHSSFELKDSGFAELSCDSGKTFFGKFIFEKKEEPKPESKIYSNKIYINELLPKPLKDSRQEEFIELYNSSTTEEKLDGWKLQDRAKSICDLSGTSIKASDFLVIRASEIKKRGNKCTLTINDTKGEEILLLNPDEKIISSVAYSGTVKENYSYSFNGNRWKWTEFLTPGEENEFADYSGKIRIVSLSPNPKGKDTKEWIEIKNGTKKEINLKNWSVATGWKKLSNHPIRKDFKIKPGKSKKLTKKICAFTLNNSKNKIELRDPLGEVVQKIKYDRKKEKILDDEIYQINGKKWSWDKSASPVSAKKKTIAKTTAPANSPSAIVPIPTVSEEELKAKEEPARNASHSDAGGEKQIEENVDKFTPKENGDEEETKIDEDFSKIETPINLALANPTPSFPLQIGRVLGAYDIRETGSKYLFTPPIEQKHWAEVLWEKANAWVSSLLLKALY